MASLGAVYLEDDELSSSCYNLAKDECLPRCQVEPRIEDFIAASILVQVVNIARLTSTVH